jgi:hypothetical protein
MRSRLHDSTKTRDLVAGEGREAGRGGVPLAATERFVDELVSLATNSPHIFAPGRRLAAFSSSLLALLAVSSSALRCIHPATNFCTEFWFGTLALEQDRDREASVAAERSSQRAHSRDTGWAQ